MYLTKLSKIRKGLRFRITLVYSTLFGLFICIFAYIISAQYRETASSDFDAALTNYAIDLSNHVQIESIDFKHSVILPKGEAKKNFPFVLGKSYHALRSIEGKILTTSPMPFGEIPYFMGLALKEDYTHRMQTIKYGEKTFRAVNLKMTSSDGKAFILQVATPSDILEDQTKRNFLINLLTIPALILLSSLVSYLLAGNALKPIKTLTMTANNIAASNLSLRVPEIDTGDEIDELSKTFNNLLARLEKAFKGQEHFVANASHQLNTPLSIIKGELDVLESKLRSPQEVVKFHKSLREELERLIDLMKNMLLVSRVEAGLESFVFYPIRLDEVLLNVLSRMRPKALEKKIVKRFNISEELVESDLVIVKGEKQLLNCLFENLLDNSIKYSPEGSTIRLDMKSGPTGLEVSIQDEGPGINEEDLQKIMSERFKRGSGTIMPGTGIGLKIAYQIAHYHNASINYQRLKPQGSLFTVKFLNKSL